MHAEHDPFEKCRQGRVLQANGRDPDPGLYVVGWAKRGPTGIIGSTTSCSYTPCLFNWIFFPVVTRFLGRYKLVLPGWLERGILRAWLDAATGTNLVDAAETAECIVEDAQQGRLLARQGSSVREELARHNIQVRYLDSRCRHEIT